MVKEVHLHYDAHLECTVALSIEKCVGREKKREREYVLKGLKCLALQWRSLNG